MFISSDRRQTAPGLTWDQYGGEESFWVHEIIFYFFVTGYSLGDA
jgi:hypothetical protein